MPRCSIPRRQLHRNIPLAGWCWSAGEAPQEVGTRISPSFSRIYRLTHAGIGSHNLGRKELAWHGIETNQFGTDEFLKWCEIVGTEPYLALNFGTDKKPPSLERGYRCQSLTSFQAHSMRPWAGSNTATPTTTATLLICAARMAAISRTGCVLALSWCFLHI